MYNIVLFVGLPGSGKTYHANRMDAIIVDDIFDLAQLPSLEVLGQKDLAITDINFCKKSTLELARGILKEKYPRFSIHTIYFENNPEQCIKNVIYRDDNRKVFGAIDMLKKVYQPPKHSLNIWHPEE